MKKATTMETIRKMSAMMCVCGARVSVWDGRRVCVNWDGKFQESIPSHNNDSGGRWYQECQKQSTGLVWDARNR